MSRTQLQSVPATDPPASHRAAKARGTPTTRHSLPAETNRQRFLRIGQYRVVNALKAMRLVGNLAGQGYEYHPDDIALMRNTIGDAVEEAFSRFEKGRSAAKLEQTFKLADMIQH